MLPYLLRWLFLASLTGVLAGLGSAALLLALDWATLTRTAHPWLLWLLPLAGLAVGLLYHYTGRAVEGGNNLLIDEIHDPKRVVPKRMAPLILLGTVVTHLFGGSAGREGTAVQMGGSFADGLTRLFRLDNEARRILLMSGISAGFASVFGTRWRAPCSAWKCWPSAACATTRSCPASWRPSSATSCRRCSASITRRMRFRSFRISRHWRSARWWLPASSSASRA